MPLVTRLSILVPVFLSLSSLAFADSPDIGKNTFDKQCSSCHGKKGEGNQAIKAPKLAGRDDWYIKHQLDAFKQGYRGTASGDSSGATMAGMAKTLNDKKIKELSEYLNKLPDVKNEIVVKGDAEKGKQYFDNLCGSCHGPGGKGNQALNAPKLAGLNDWYIVHQLNNFRSGKRGYHADDKLGKQMKMMSGIIPSDQAIKDIATYLSQQN